MPKTTQKATAIRRQAQTTEARNAADTPHTCTSCGVTNCYRQDAEFPPFCPTAKAGSNEINASVASYRKRGIDRTLALAAADVEGTYYGRLTRVEETIAFARRIGAQRIGLLEEARIFSRIVEGRLSV